ncbi:hypothetical protein G7Y79_00034g070030 [Physcia stellaris]|nr:hypothetical protein G7Y79_00034g070030 [Physcia stellaris]
MAGNFYGSQRSVPPSLGRLITPAPGAEDDEQDERGASPEQTSTPPPAPPPARPRPSQQPRPTHTDPTEPERPKIVEEWETIFEVHGRRGLQKAFYDFGRRERAELHKKDPEERGNAKTSWDHLLKDENQGTNHVLHLLHSLPSFIITALLRGDLPHQMYTDFRVRQYVQDYMQPEEAPGIYVNILHSRDGHWLSGNDMERLLDIMNKYVTVEADGNPRQDQVDIDQRLSPWNPWNPPKQDKMRWLQGKRAPVIIKKWIQQAEKAYCTNTTDPDEPFISCPTEVGWAVSTRGRCKQHMNNSSTTYLFGLLNAILRMHKPAGFAFPQPTQILLFPVWERTEMLGRVAEIVGSLLCHSYYYHGGLNGYYAGSMTWSKELPNALSLTPPPSSAYIWGTSAQTYWRRLQYEKPIIEEIEKARRLGNQIYEASSVDDLDDELKKVRAENDAKMAEKTKLDEELKKERADLAALEARHGELLPPSTQLEAELEEAAKALSLGMDKIDKMMASRKDWTP